MILDTKAKYKAILLDADLSSNIAFVKIMSPRQHKVAKLAKLDYLAPESLLTVAVGCDAQRDLHSAKAAHYLCLLGY